MIHPYRNSFSFSEKIFLLSGVTLGAVTFLMAKISLIWLAAYGAMTLLYASYKCTRGIKIDKPPIIEKKVPLSSSPKFKETLPEKYRALTVTFKQSEEIIQITPREERTTQESYEFGRTQSGIR